jgi:hypothetical protein
MPEIADEGGSVQRSGRETESKNDVESGGYHSESRFNVGVELVVDR